MLRIFSHCPEGAEQTSPGQRPGKRGCVQNPSPERAAQLGDCFALTGRCRARWWYPFAARRSPPGRCPGLICGCPFGTQEAQQRNIKTRERGAVLARPNALRTCPESDVGLRV